MCGIWALSRADKSSITDGRFAMLAGLLAIEDRGPHSTGLAYTIGKERTVWYTKAVGTASKVIGELDIDGKTRVWSAVGHVRYSTQGAHTYDNAHPVVADSTVLVHNGVLDNDDDLIEQAGIERVGEVDSFAAAAIIEAAPKLGFTTLEALQLIDGDFALAWLDADDTETLHLVRGNGRPLAIGFTKRGDLVAASTPANLRMWSTLTRTTLHEIASSDNFDLATLSVALRVVRTLVTTGFPVPVGIRTV